MGGSYKRDLVSSPQQEEVEARNNYSRKNSLTKAASKHRQTLSLSLSLSLSLPQDLSQLHCGNEQQKGRENGILSTTALQKTAPTSLQSRGSDYKPARCNSSNALLQTGPAAIEQLEKLVLQSAEPYTCFT
jgi:hypothetical protein